jgi:hypothetical protein
MPKEMVDALLSRAFTRAGGALVIIGQILAHYKITGPIGARRMGPRVSLA